MRVILGVVDAALPVIRGAFLALAAILAAVCGVDWLVRTRRVSPFGPVARFMRTTVDPLILPVERRIVRSGGLPSSAPWWALAAVVLAGIVLISILEFARTQAALVALAIDSGPGGIYRLLVSWTIAILQVALIVRVVLSWVHAPPGAWYVRWSYQLTEPILRPLRRLVPMMGMMDITPIIAWFLLGLLRGFLLGLG
ncbi:MAG TPA: YggT family protein [Gemmatimonadaceae bacterium]|nr:YggT family protein [Gemmatimonadaceae bacterium]